MADENAPATKKDLQEFEGPTTKDFRETGDRLSKQMRDMQTGNSVQSVKMRMDTMERRLGEIEKKLLLNPPAA